MNNYLRYYGIFYIVILLMLVGFGTIYLNDINSITVSKFNPPVHNTDTVKKQDDVPYVKGSITAPVDLSKFNVSTPELIEKGKTLFGTQCASCHGSDGKGDGVAGLSLNPKPRNFHSLEGWTNGVKLSEMYKTLHDGITNRGMASYSNLSPEERFALIHYIRTYASYPAITEEDMNDIDMNYSLRKGIKTPTQIPVKTAGEKLISESKQYSEKISALAEIIKKPGSEKAATILKMHSKDIVKVLTGLYNYKKWSESETALMNYAVKNPEEKGFKSSVSLLKQDEWTAIYGFLKSQLNF